jgi:hypothetical protein
MVATVASGVLAGPAWAQKRTITCTGFSGVIVVTGETVGSVWGCSGDTGSTGSYFSGPGFSVNTTSLTITWANGTSTTATFATHVANTNIGCSNGFKLKTKGRVSADTSGSTRVNSKVSFAFCELPTVSKGIYTMTMPTVGKFKL